MSKLTTHQQLSIIVNQDSVGVSDAITNVPNPTTVSLTPTGGDSIVEYTLDPTFANWQSWARGTVSVYAEDVLVADVIALRVKVVSGTAVMTLIGGRNG